jgi:seryl-tRNA synthetase
MSTVPELSVELTDPVPRFLADELAKRVFFVAEEIEGFDLVLSDDGEGTVRGVRVTSRAPLPPDELRRKLDRVVANDILPQRNVRPREVWRSSHLPDLQPKVFDDMLTRGMVAVAGEGQMALAAPFTDLLARLDRRVRHLAAAVVQAEERRYPTLIPTEVLARSGYVTSFPQFLLFVNRLHGDIDTYESFLAETRDGTASAAAARHSDHAGYTLSPAVCYHVYQQLSGTTPASPLLRVTACGTCYRHESRYHRSLERLWEFTMREIVLVGEEALVAEARQRIMDAVFDLVEELGLAGHCEAASDPFFCDARTARKVWSQRALELKYELVLPVSGDGAVAAASFNVHGPTLGEAFDITSPEGGPVHTGCVAFGLERLAYAIVSRHGLDPDAWPDIEGARP